MKTICKNWHEITGGNGMCECGNEKGRCNQMLKNELRSEILWAAEMYAHNNPKEKHSEFLLYILSEVGLSE